MATRHRPACDTLAPDPCLAERQLGQITKVLTGNTVAGAAALI